MPSSHLILCRPLLLLPPVPPSIRDFSNESGLRTRWPKFWSFSLSISPSNEHPGLISFRMDWLDLLAVQGTLKSLLQHYSSKATILRCSAFITVQLSHPYIYHSQWSPERPLPTPQYQCLLRGTLRNSLSHRHKSREHRVSCRNPRKTSRVLLQRVLRTDSPTMTREQ